MPAQVYIPSAVPAVRGAAGWMHAAYSDGIGPPGRDVRRQERAALVRPGVFPPGGKAVAEMAGDAIAGSFFIGRVVLVVL